MLIHATREVRAPRLRLPSARGGCYGSARPLSSRGGDAMRVVKIHEVPSLRQRVSEEEWQARVDLAAAYRLVAHYGWTHLINNHISVRVPGTRRSVPDQPLRPALRAGHRLEPGQDRRRRQRARRHALRGEPRGLRHPQRDPHGAQGPARHPAHPHGGRTGDLGARLRAADAQPERHALLQAHRLPRVRRRRATISTSASASSPISATTSA